MPGQRQHGIRVIRHAKGAPGLRLIGLGSGILPNHGLHKLQDLLNQHTFWANQRSIQGLRKMLQASSVVVSVWKSDTIIGFGRANSDGLYRAVLWDVVVAESHQGQGVGSLIVNTLISSDCIKVVERIYLMTTKSSGFYVRLGFRECESQQLMYKDRV